MGVYIANRRLSLELTQEDLSEMSGVGQKTIYHIENGEGNPGMQAVRKIAAILGLEFTLYIKQLE